MVFTEKEKKTALEAFVGMHEGMWTSLYDGTFTDMHTFFFVSCLSAMSPQGRGARQVGMDY